MAALKIPATYDPNSVLIADDEPEHLEWLVDYLEAKGQNVSVVTNVKDAMELSETKWFRAYVIDLNIPLGGWVMPTKPIYVSYPGFAIIQGIRSQGSDGRRVIAYSAHSNEQIAGEMKRLYTDYVAKGRPIQLKDKFFELWGMADQTAATLVRMEEWNGRRQELAATKRARKLASARPAKRVARKSAKPPIRPKSIAPKLAKAKSPLAVKPKSTSRP